MASAAHVSDAFNLATIQEAIAEAVPDRECIVYRDRRLTWRTFTERTRRLANYLRSRDLGCRRERSELRNWESGQDHLGLYLHNCNEYLEGMLGAYQYPRSTKGHVMARPLKNQHSHVADALQYLCTGEFSVTTGVALRTGEAEKPKRMWNPLADPRTVGGGGSWMAN